MLTVSLGNSACLYIRVLAHAIAHAECCGRLKHVLRHMSSLVGRSLGKNGNAAQETVVQHSSKISPFLVETGYECPGPHPCRLLHFSVKAFGKPIQYYPGRVEKGEAGARQTAEFGFEIGSVLREIKAGCSGREAHVIFTSFL
jgi:hypothetical protein